MSRLDLEALLGELAEHVDAASPDADFTAYHGRPAEFLVEVLGMRLLAWQRRWLAAFHTARQFVIWSGNGVGKSAMLAGLLVYFAVVVKGTALYFSATEKQTRTQMVTALKRLVVGRFAADVYTYGVAFYGGAGAIYFANAGDVSAMQGHHGADLLVVADEAQALEDEQLAAIQGNTVGERNVLVLSGNPILMGGPLYAVATGADPSWHRTKVTAFDVIDDPEAPYLPGLVSRRWVHNLRQTWGEDSSVFQSRVYANFPKTPSDAFFPAEAIARTFAVWDRPEWHAYLSGRRLTLGVDVAASTDGDESVIAVARAGYVYELITWREPDTMKSVGFIVGALERLRIARIPSPRLTQELAIMTSGGAGRQLVMNQPGDPLRFLGREATIRVDEIGVGRGVSDRLKEQGFDCQPFNASKRPDRDDEFTRFQNQRAAAYTRFRDLLVRGQVGLPPDPLLRQELETCRAHLNSSGRLQIISKEEWRKLIGRSPDRLDAVVMACAGSGAIEFSAEARPIAF